MKYRARKRVRLGPIFINLTERQNPIVALLVLIFTGGRRRLFSSWGVKVGPYTRNFTRGTSSFDTPGPGAVYWSDER